MPYYGASLMTVSALLLKRLHLRVHDLGGHTLTAPHANGTASNGPDRASAVQRRAILYKETLDPSQSFARAKLSIYA